jgi:hypothetical protein
MAMPADDAPVRYRSRMKIDLREIKRRMVGLPKMGRGLT